MKINLFAEHALMNVIGFTRKPSLEAKRPLCGNASINITQLSVTYCLILAHSEDWDIADFGE